MGLAQILAEFKRKANPQKAQFFKRFFKTAPGQYGHGDVFLGLTVPEQRKIALRHADLTFADIKKLLASEAHEHRLTALLILTHRFKRADQAEQAKIYKFLFTNRARVNNWDLVDLAAPTIFGQYLISRNHKILYQLAQSKNIWDRRIAIVSTLAFIRAGQLKDTLKICIMLLGDHHDLIHKASGWMLREVGKKSEKTLTQFLDKYALKMPRTTLRYALERLSRAQRVHYMQL